MAQMLHIPIGLGLDREENAGPDYGMTMMLSEAAYPFIRLRSVMLTTATGDLRVLVSGL